MKSSDVAKLVGLTVGVGFLSSCVRILSMWLKARRMHKMVANVPQADYTDTFLGIAPGLIKNLHRRHDWIEEISSKHSICKVHIGPKFDPCVMQLWTKNPAIIKHVLKDNFENYSKPPSSRNLIFGHLNLWLGEGIFVARHGLDANDGGRNWQRQRKISSNIFTRGNFNNNMGEVFLAKGHRMCELLRDSASNGERLDLQKMFFGYTMDSIMQIFFGESSDTMSGEANDYALAFDTAHRSLIEFALTNTPKLVMMKLLPWPFGGNFGLAHRLFAARNPLFREFKSSFKTLDTESRRLIASCRADPKIHERKDLLALFVQAEEQERFSTAWLRDMVLNFVIAGRDTTACLLSWMFYMLATHPEIQQKLQAEIDAKFGSGTSPTIKGVAASEMPYLNGVLYEALRLYPPVPINFKEAQADDVLPDGTPVPKHGNVTYLTWVMGRDPERYPDPLAVKPERWIPFREPQPHEFPVFQAGPRICLGMNMSIFEAKIAASMLLRDYSFKLAPGEAEKISYLPAALTMSICNSKDRGTFDSHNLWVIPTRRQP